MPLTIHFAAPAQVLADDDDEADRPERLEAQMLRAAAPMPHIPVTETPRDRRRRRSHDDVQPLSPPKLPRRQRRPHDPNRHLETHAGSESAMTTNPIRHHRPNPTAS